MAIVMSSSVVVEIVVTAGTHVVLISNKMDPLLMVMPHGELTLSRKAAVSLMTPLSVSLIAHRQTLLFAAIAIDPAILRTGASRRGMISELIFIKVSMNKSMVTLLSMSLPSAHMSTLVLLWQQPDLPFQNFQCRSCMTPVPTLTSGVG